MTVGSITSTGTATVQTTPEEVSVNQQVWDSTMEQVDKTSDRLEAQMALMRRNIDTMDDLNQAISKLSLSQEAGKKDGDGVTITTEMKDAALTAGVWVEGADTAIGTVRWDPSDPQYISQGIYDDWVANGRHAEYDASFKGGKDAIGNAAIWYSVGSGYGAVINGNDVTVHLTASQLAAAGTYWNSREAVFEKDAEVVAMRNKPVLISGNNNNSFPSQRTKDTALHSLYITKNLNAKVSTTITKMPFLDYISAVNAVKDKSDSNTIKNSMNLSQVTKLIAKIRADLEKLQGSSQLDSTQLQRMNSAYNTLLQMLSELLSKFSKTTDAIVGALK